jgi:hypothetical protein
MRPRNSAQAGKRTQIEQPSQKSEAKRAEHNKLRKRVKDQSQNKERKRNEQKEQAGEHFEGQGTKVVAETKLL